jgi:hypothetical protein
VGQEQVDQADFEQAGDAVELAPAHVAHLFDHVLPIHGVVHPPPTREAAEQVGLLLGPEEDVGVVEAAHGRTIRRVARWLLSRLSFRRPSDEKSVKSTFR